MTLASARMGGHCPRPPAVPVGLGELLPLPSQLSEVHGCLVPFSPVLGPGSPGSRSPLSAATPPPAPPRGIGSYQRLPREAAGRRLWDHGAESYLAQPPCALQPAEPGAPVPLKGGPGVAPGWACAQPDVKVDKVCEKEEMCVCHIEETSVLCVLRYPQDV